MRHIIIGDGATGTTAAYYIRSVDRSASITIVSDDPNPAYYRAALTNYMLGELHESQLFAVPPDFYIENRIDRVLARVAAVDTGNNRVTLADNRQIEYDQLLIASGSRPNAPTFPGAELSGVMTIRTLQDVRAVVDGIRSGRIKRAVVVGGGPLGIEWVQGLMHYKVHVTYLLRGDMFFERALDRTASDLVISRLRAEGVDVRMNEEVAKAIKGWDGRLRAVQLKNSKQVIDCQLVGAAIGIRPNIEFLKDSGIEVARNEKSGMPLGVVVDKHMRSNVPNVYGGGDVINRTLGLWEPARLQGRVAGRNMVGGSAAYEAGEYYFATRLYDLDFSSVGNINNQPDDMVLVDFPRGSGRIVYRKLVVRGGKLIGALMLGHRKENVRKHGLFYKKLIEDKVDISKITDRLIDPSFDLPGWIDALNLGNRIEVARSLIMTAVVPSPAAMLKGESAETTNTFAIQSPASPKAVLKWDKQSLPLERLVSIGRLEDNQIVIAQPVVSSRHATIEQRGDAYIITDNNSTNGTLVNDTRITGSYVLKDGDVIKIGDKSLQFEAHSNGQAVKSSTMPEEISLAQPPADAILGRVQYNGRQIDINREAVTIGRDAQAGILIDDPTVSFMHAQISFHGNRHYLRDLGSRNGTFVNENLVVTPCVLKNGDVIRVGAVKLTFTTNAEALPAAPEKQPEQVKTEFFTREKSKEVWGQLVIYSGATIGLTFALKPPSVTVGRDVETSDIGLQHQTVSRRHARLDWRDDKWFVTDLQSGNGTFVNGFKLGSGAEKQLSPKDEIQFGAVKLVFVPPSSSPQPLPSFPTTFMIESNEEPPSPEKNAEVAKIMVEAGIEAPASKEAPQPADLPVDNVNSDATRLVQSSYPTYLTVLAGPAIGQTIKLVNLPLMLGRTSTPEVQGLDDPLVSRQHLKIILTADGSIGVSDWGSVNGTILNGIPLEINKVAILQKGDELRLGSTVLKVG